MTKILTYFIFLIPTLIFGQYPFEKIKAPKKEYYLLPNAAHGFNESVVETQYKIFKSIRTE